MTDEILNHDVNEIKNSLSALSMKVSLVYDALIGNAIAQDGGIVQELKDMKSETKDLTKRIVIVENGQTKKQFYLNIIYGAIGVIITLVITHFLNLIK